MVAPNGGKMIYPHFWWSCSHADQWVRLPVQGFLLVFYSNQGPDLQNILRQSYDYLMIMPKLRSTYDGRLIYKTFYNEWKAFHW